MQCKPPSWFADKLKHLAQTGKLDLSGEAFDDLSFVGSRPSMKQLDISFTPIQTIEGLQLQPKLDTLIADSSELVSFKNFRAVQKISSISIKNTPVSHLPNFKLSLLIVIGPTLRVINGQYISSKMREKAKQYPPIASDLINCGWMAEYPCPEESEMDKICQKYGLADFDDDPDDTPESFVQQNTFDLEQAVNYYTSVHKRVIEQAHQQIKNASLDFEEFHLPPIEREQLGNEENSFLDGLESDVGINICDKVQILLHHHGYKVDPKNRVESMIVILSKLLEIDSHDSFEEEEEEEEEKVEVNFKNNKLSKNKKIDKKRIENNENKVIKRCANGKQDESKSNEENKQVQIVQNKKNLNQNKANENDKQVKKKSKQNKNKESNQFVEKEKVPNKKVGNKGNNKRKDEITIQADFDDYYYENDDQDHLDHYSYNDNSNSFENKFNINNDDDYEYDDFNESKDIHKNEKVLTTKKNVYNNVSIDSNKDDYNYESLIEEEEEGSEINVSDYIKIEYTYDISKKKKVHHDNDSENTEKEIDISLDSITKEQLNTSGIDGQFFELANHCSSQSDIREIQDGEDASWNQFLAQLKNET